MTVGIWVSQGTDGMWEHRGMEKQGGPDPTPGEIYTQIGMQEKSIYRHLRWQIH